MKRKFFLPLVALLLALVPFAFKDKTTNTTDLLKANFQKDLELFKSKVAKFESTLDKGGKQEATKAYMEVRKAYKQIEPIIFYFDKAAVLTRINAAPLPKLELNAPEIRTLYPKGLQVIDEAMGEKVLDKGEIKRLTTQLLSDLEMVRGTMRLENTTLRMVIEIYQMNLIKIFAIEQTGFDTPSSLNGVEDSKTTIKAINKLFFLFFDRVKLKRGDYDQLKKQMQAAEKSLMKAKEFERFDRLAFLRQHIEPLYESINKLHTISGIEYLDEVTRVSSHVNLRSDHIFSNSFLNKKTYSMVDPADTAMVELGKNLFFDPILSKNGKRSCASCHDPQKGFTDNMETSLAFDFKGRLKRNSPTIMNSIYASDYFWDLRANEIRNQVEHVVFSPDEFNSGFTLMELRLRKSEAYQKQFKQCFPNEIGGPVTKNSITLALTAYVQSISSWNSAFDTYVRGESKHLNQDAKAGYNLFMGKAQCGICHFAPSFSGLIPPFYEDSESEVLGVTDGLDTVNPVLDSDLGRFKSTKIKDRAPFFNRSFKTMTVRNAKLTFPYMHNGKFKTLEDVLHFYNHGGGAGMGLNVPNQTLPDSKLNLTKQEMKQIISFIESLTDTSMVSKSIPKQLPLHSDTIWANRKIGGEY